MPKHVGEIRATVRWFSDIKGFGFLSAPGFEGEFFCHYSAIEDEDAPVVDGRPFRTLAELQEVDILEYLKDRDGKLKALKVRKL